jgi:hypothetical protein
LYLSPNIIKQIKSRRMRWAGYVARMGGDRKVHKVGKVRWKETTGRRRHRWNDGIRMDLREIGWEGSGFGWLRTGTDGGLL